MKCLVINLSTATARMAFMAHQMQRLGLSYERVEAVTPESLGETRAARYWERWERPLKATEKACFLSHVAAWKRVAETNEPMLVLEDDALLSGATADVLQACLALHGVDHLTLEVRKRKKIVAKASQSLTASHRRLQLFQDRSGAAAYVLWPSGAQKLFRRAEAYGALADAMICGAYELASFQVEPACAVQLDRAAAYGIESPAPTPSQIDAGAPAPERRSLPFKLRRVAAQLRMARRAIRHSAGAERREIRLDPGDFSAQNPQNLP